MSNQSKTPIADLGDAFEPSMMPDYPERAATGEFAGKTDHDIHLTYIEKEAEENHEAEQSALDEQEQEDDE